MDKNGRKQAVREIIKKFEIDTQDELAEKLKDYGFNCTQATMCRDIRELGIIKVKGITKNFMYTIPEKNENKMDTTKIESILRGFVTYSKCALNQVVVKTHPGSASSCGACIDNLKLEGVLGCICGDDTILIVTEDEYYAEDVCKYIKNISNL